MSIFTTIRRWALYLCAVFLGWLSVLTGVMLLSDAAPGAIAFFPASDFISNLPEGASVADAGAVWVGVRSDAPGLGVSLYRAGALLVLPAGLPGCLPLPG